MQKHLPILILLLFFALLMAGCAASLPVVTPAATPGPDATAAPASPPAPNASPAATATPEPAPPPEPTATPAPLPEHPTLEETLAAGLHYVHAGFKLKLPPAEQFQPAPPPEMTSVEIEQTLAGGQWLAQIGPMQVDEVGRGLRIIILSNAQKKETMRWWGQVDETGLASSLVFTAMPRPKSTRIKGMTGTLHLLPNGSAYARYFENAKGERFGIASNKETIATLLNLMTDDDGPIQVWGELRYAVDDYLGRRILVRKYDLQEAEPETILARTPAATPAIEPAPEQEPEIDVGPLATLLQPAAQTILTASVMVTGVVEHANGPQVLIQIEDADGQILGQGAATLDDQGQFSLALPFTDPPSLSAGRIAVYQPEDALLLGWQQVRFAGPVNGQLVEITQPQAMAELRGQVNVAGTAQNLQTDTLLVRIEDTAGVVMGKAKVQPGAEGFWQTKIKCRRPKTARSGVVAVYAFTPENDLILLAIQPIKLKK